jgi:hypothetical protein
MYFLLACKRTRNGSDAFLISQNFTGIPVLQMDIYSGRIKPGVLIEFTEKYVTNAVSLPT